MKRFISRSQTRWIGLSEGDGEKERRRALKLNGCAVRVYQCARRSRSTFVAITCALILSAGPVAFAQSDAGFAKANQDYAAGHFKEAIDEYENLVRSGQWSANLFYDLGNAYFRAGDFGRAILNYERALALEPRHPETQANLQIARDEARALELPQSRLERYLEFATARQYAIAAAIAFWLAAVCLVQLIFSRRRPTGLISLSALLLVTFALLVAAVFWIDHGNNGRALGIVTTSGI